MAENNNYPDTVDSRSVDIIETIINQEEYDIPPQSRLEEVLLELKEAIEEGGGSDGTHFKGTTTTALTDGATTNPITIDGESYTAVIGDIVIYNSTEFIFDGSAWQSFGETMDTQPTQNSAKAVTSDGVYRYTAGKKDLSSGGEIFNSYTGMYANSASGNYSHAEGRSNKAYGNNSHVEGYSCSTHGEAANSHAEGNTTYAGGQASHAEGAFTQAIGDYSHAGGRGTYAITEASTVIGTYNVPDANGVENLFIVGNGSEDSQGNFTQSNILEVSKTAMNVNGDIKQNGTAIAALAFKSSATGTALTTAGTLPSLIYDSANERLVFDAGTLPTTGTVTVS